MHEYILVYTMHEYIVCSMHAVWVYIGIISLRFE